MKGDKDGIYTIEIEGLKKGDLYKYHVEGYDGICRYKSDPFAFYAECRPDTASKVWDFDDFKWSDKRFINLPVLPSNLSDVLLLSRYLHAVSA